MKTAELWKQYQGYTRDLTEHSRKLGFAGAAICWFFKTDQVTFPSMIYWGLAFFVGYFIADILHYMMGALVTKLFVERAEFKMLEETGGIDGEIPKPRWLDWPAFTFFLLKSILLTCGFVFIGCELAIRL